MTHANSEIDYKEVRESIKSYELSNHTHQWLRLLMALGGFGVCILGNYYLWTNQPNFWYVAFTAIVIMGGLFTVKIFSIQHDCGHESYFNNNTYNIWVGRVLSLITMVPYESWRHEHNLHHNGVVNIEERTLGDIALLTEKEYAELPRWKKIGYYLYRTPFFLFVIGPFFYFFLRNRVPMVMEKKIVLSVMVTNIALGFVYFPLLYIFGFWTVFMVFAPITYLAGMIGIGLFYVQHQFEDAHWFETDEWDHAQASIEGSSCLVMPAWLEWFTLNIGYHHIHHFNSKIPGSRLKEVFHENQVLNKKETISVFDFVPALNMKLWSGKDKKMATFDE